MSRAVNVDNLIKQCKVYGVLNKRDVRTHVELLLRETLSLHVRVGTLYANDGTASTLLQIYGTVPIWYKHNQYNIPVNIWVTANYPKMPPQVYVTPTQDMRVKERHKHVDRHGLVYLPYLHSWKHPGSSLVELVGYLSSIFSEDPPVYKYVAPAAHAHRGGHAHAGAAVAQPSPYANPHMQVHRQHVQPQGAVGHHPGAHMQHPGAGAHGQWGAHPAGGGGGGGGGGAAAGFGAAAAGAAVGAAVMGAGASAAARKEKLVGEVTQKLRKALTQFNKDTTDEINGLFEKQERMHRGGDQAAAAVTAVQAHCDKLKLTAEQADAEAAALEAWLEEHDSKESELSVDELVTPTDTWSRQLFEEVAADNAIDDTIYALTSAVGDGSVDLETMLTRVRSLAKQQFKHRYLAMKIHAKQRERKQSVVARPPVQYI